VRLADLSAPTVMPQAVLAPATSRGVICGSSRARRSLPPATTTNRMLTRIRAKRGRNSR
jgi:hypothetical protein